MYRKSRSNSTESLGVGLVSSKPSLTAEQDWLHWWLHTGADNAQISSEAELFRSVFYKLCYFLFKFLKIMFGSSNWLYIHGSLHQIGCYKIFIKDYERKILLGLSNYTLKSLPMQTYDLLQLIFLSYFNITSTTL